MAKEILKKDQFFRNRDILVLGCNDSYLIFDLLKKGVSSITGVDSSKEKIDEARAGVLGSIENVKLWNVDILSREFQLFLGQYDIIILDLKFWEIAQSMQVFLTFFDTHCRQSLISFVDNDIKIAVLDDLENYTSFKVHEDLGDRIVSSKGGHEIRVEDWINLPVEWIPAKDIKGPSKFKWELIKNQPRIINLKDNIEKNGLRNPIIVAKNVKAGKKFIGMEGGKRFLVLTKLLEWTDIPCRVAPSQKRTNLRF